MGKKIVSSFRNVLAKPEMSVVADKIAGDMF